MVRNKLVTALLAVPLLFWGSSSLAQGDDCGTAVAVAPGIHTADGPGAGAGASNVCSAANGDAAATNADWYSYTATADGTIDISSCIGGTDTRLSVYDGGCGTLNCIAYNDDMGAAACPAQQFASAVSGVPVVNGTTYYIEWDDRWDTGTFDWELTLIPCTAPVASADVTTDCTAGTFMVNVDVSSTGSGATVDIEYDVNAAPQPPVTAGTGITALGPFTIGDVVDITNIAHETEAACDLGSLGSYEAATCITCNAIPVNQTYCYTSNDDNSFTYIQDGAGTLRLTFNRGTLESSSFDNLIIYDSADDSGPILWANGVNEPGNTGNLGPVGSGILTTDPDFFAVDVFSTSGAIHMTITSDASVDCATSGTFDAWDWDVVCVLCSQPTATVTVDEDCLANNEFSLNIDLTDLGTASTVDITEDVNGGGVTVVHDDVSLLTTYVLGPYTNGSSVDVQVLHNDDPICDLDLGNTTFNCSPTLFCGALSSVDDDTINDGLPAAMDTIVVSGFPGELVTDMDVVVDLTHTFIGDLDITVTSPDGTVVNLWDNLCGGNNDLTIRFNDEAGAAPVCAQPTFGDYTPSFPLSAFDGDVLDGDWILTITDGAGGDNGNLVQWCLIPTSAAPDCPDSPSDLSVAAVSSSTVTIDWTSGGGANTGYSIEYGPVGFMPGGGGTTVAGALPGPVVIGPLASGTSFDFYLTETCLAGNTITIGPVTGTTLTVVSSFPYCQDFDTEANCANSGFPTCTDPCALSVGAGWFQDAGDDQDWLTNSANTGSGATGPNGDAPNNGAGIYLYTESSGACNNTTAILNSPAFNAAAMTNDPQVSFNYHMFGADMGTLALEAEIPSGSGTWTTVWSQTGQVQTSNGDAWIQQIVPIAGAVGGFFSARFVGTTGGGFNSDMAIDSICVDEGICIFPVASYTTTCLTDTTYEININVTSTGTDATVDIDTTTVNGSGSAFTGVGVGIHTVGPFEGFFTGSPVDILVAGSSTAGCEVSLNVPAADCYPIPPNDTCANVTPVVLGLGTNTINGTSAGGKQDEWSDLFGVPGMVFETFTLTEPCNFFRLDFCGMDPVWGNGAANIFLSCDPNGGFVPPDDFGTNFCPGGDLNFSIFYNNLAPGTYVYPIFSDPGQDLFRDYTMTITNYPCPSDLCTDAVTATCGNEYLGSTAGLTNTLPAGGCLFCTSPSTGGVNWYEWDASGAAMDEEVNVTTCNIANFDTRISVYEDVLGDCSTLQCLVQNDDGAGCAGFSSDTKFLAEAGKVYKIAIHGFGGAEGTYRVQFGCAPACATPLVGSDVCPTATPQVPVLNDGLGVPVTDDNTCAFADVNPPCDAFGGMQGVWYLINSGVNTEMNITLLTNNEDAAYTASDISYAIYDACPTVCPVTPLDCQTGAGGTNGLPTLTPATDYWVNVWNDGGIGVQGSFGVLFTFPAQNDAAITQIVAPAGTVCSSTFDPVVELTNNGVLDLTSVEIVFSIDGGTPMVYNWTGSLGYQQSELVTLPTQTEAFGPHTFDAATNLPNGVVDEIPADDAAPQSAFDIGGEPMIMAIQTDNFGSETTWEIYDSFFLLVASGGPYADFSPTLIEENLCLSTEFGSCYSAFIYDAFGDGMCCGQGPGYWEIQDGNGRVLLRDIFEDAADGSQSPSTTPAGAGYFAHEFCLPAGPSTVEGSECGIFTNNLLNKVYTKAVGGVSSYQFEFSDPDYGFIRRIAVPRNWVRFSEMVSVPLVPGNTYFCRVRVDQGFIGFFGDDHFGTGCEMGLDPVQVPGCTELIDNVGSPTHSCGTTKEFMGSDKIYAIPLVGATQYRFLFTNAGEGYARQIAQPSYVCWLHWFTDPLQPGVTYDVQVEALVNGQWSGFCGATCQVTIQPPGPAFAAKNLSTTSPEAMLWPNPVKDGVVQLLLNDLQDEQQKINVEVFDMFGKQVMAEQFGNSGSVFNTVLDLDENMSKGVYLVNITVNGKVFTERLTVQ